MSRAYDARQQAISAYPDIEDKFLGISLFLGYLDISSEDFEFEFNQTVEDYLYGD